MAGYCAQHSNQPIIHWLQNVNYVLHANERKREDGAEKEGILPGKRRRGCCRRQWLAVVETMAGGLLCFFPSLSLSSFFSFLLLLLLFSLVSRPSLSRYPFFFLFPSLFRLLLRLFFFFFFLLPLLRVSMGRRKVTVPFITALFWALFFLTVHETAPFWTKRAISFKRKRRQNMSEYKSVLNLWFVQSSPQLQFWFKINAIAPLPKIQQRPYSWPPFSLWSFVLILCNLTLNWAINF